MSETDFTPSWTKKVVNQANEKNIVVHNLETSGLVLKALGYLDLLMADLSFVLNSFTLFPASENARAVCR